MPLRFAEVADEAYRYPLTIKHLLDRALITSGDQEIIYRDQARFTYREFADRIRRLASVLSSLGGEEGMTISVLDWDSHRYLEAYFAVPMMGAVLQSVNVRLPIEQILYTLVHTSPGVILIHHDFFPFVEDIRRAVPGLKAIIAIMDGTDDPLPDWAVGEYEALSQAADPAFEFKDFDENAIATTFFTSGTTGNPKGVCFSHRQLVLHALALCGHSGDTRHRGFGIDDVYMPLTPMFHVHAWGMPYVAIMLGLKQVYPGRYDADLICKLRTEHGVTYSHGVPTILQLLISAADRTGTDLSGWMMVIGGSALTPALFEEGRRRGMELVCAYGMSESGPILTITRRLPGTEAGSADEGRLLTRAGVPIPLVSARIVDENMNTLPNDGRTRGELVVRAPWLTPCYVGDEAGSAALWRGGWLHTQDVASIDAHGNITICDRLKDVIKSGGEWIDSILLEGIVANAQGVAEVAVVAVPDDHWGERPLAVIVPAFMAEVTLAAINAPIEQAIAKSAITRYAKLDRFVIVDALPKTSVGKIDKKRLRAQYGAAASDSAIGASSVQGERASSPVS
ncbi:MULTISPECIES: long-chain-fatty-acid--CoA ligase [unclassified Sphingobium]|uniref:long-chain-fatty-acid--CoA ligase n=1 Tax=unclassified Sphingobium TaxID=2611147 RepID=UPI0007701932|nr:MULTISPECIES: long-chain-fatty-acid--CoA ligase [Sphingomonadaceae]AMK24345.1 o-succinylbenzoate--CoA ligase [Sphingobium sp. TKS]NML90415.1 long-chain-fatty-acid--CoA ligase [Sphingobium sp. TB-6]